MRNRQVPSAFIRYLPLWVALSLGGILEVALLLLRH